MTDEARRDAAVARLIASRGKYKRASSLLDEARRTERNNEDPEPEPAAEPEPERQSPEPAQL
ncbi:MAG: hypothetical protein OXC00_09255 [Acidimicrobiaceae bacterium]|nr:hypothetical protein [Acidimicrobiaceae bacterium]